jgi:hypothetical protein
MIFSDWPSKQSWLAWSGQKGLGCRRSDRSNASGHLPPMLLASRLREGAKPCSQTSLCPLIGRGGDTRPSPKQESATNSSSPALPSVEELERVVQDELAHQMASKLGASPTLTLLDCGGT